ncbi:MAG: hypothetical protein NT118_05665 [Lentisphaerae bacterium]|nr:hypothetical protein [Lentisphaerota bacterium]
MNKSGHYNLYDWFEATYISILRNNHPFTRAMAKRELRRLWLETGEASCREKPGAGCKAKQKA